MKLCKSDFESMGSSILYYEKKPSIKIKKCEEKIKQNNPKNLSLELCR